MQATCDGEPTQRCLKPKGMLQADPIRRDGRLFLHSDDFVLHGDATTVNTLHELLKTKNTAKLSAHTQERHQEQEAVTLHRAVRNVPKDADVRVATKLVPDQRHVDVQELTDDSVKGCSDATREAIRRPRHRRSRISGAETGGCESVQVRDNALLPSGSRSCRHPGSHQVVLPRVNSAEWRGI